MSRMVRKYDTAAHISPILLVALGVASIAILWSIYSIVGIVLALIAVLTVSLITAVIALLRRMPIVGMCSSCIFLTCVVALPIVVMSAHPVDLSQFQKVRIGMPMRDVRNLLGEPTEVQGSVWQYHGNMWCIVSVQFSNAGQVVDVSHDH